ncbi:MAG TPA: tetratricopeptide repeat protein [Candidatus Limnocylindrales bacterium]|nr:tetratricopeptide repeat protein [Candidatus Limnocylindrales bacterium]
MTLSPPNGTHAVLPDPGRASSLDELIERLRALRTWAGDPSYAVITDRINAVWRAAGRPDAELTRRSTVVDCFKSGRRRLNTDLVIATVQALHPDVGYVAQWRQALRVVGGETQAASQVLVQDRLPQDLAAFTGRSAELEQLRRALRPTKQGGGPVVISAIAGMAGVGKTQLAIHAGHLLTRENALTRVLFVNLRGFHPDPAQPPADPAAVLDGFLRLLGVPGQQIPQDLEARTTAYRDRLAGTRTLVVLDNAADAAQVRPLLPDTPGCLALVTSRRSLTDLQPATHLTVDVFTPDEAVEFLTRALPEVPVGSDPGAIARIAHRCGHLPLALGLVAGHIHRTPGWTLTDHADRLDERHRDRQLDTSIAVALDLSYQHLPADQQRLLRLAAQHPGQDIDAYAAAALAGTGLAAARDHLRRLFRDHLLQQATADRYSFHDLVRAYAVSRAGDEDPPAQRRAALTRLFDFYRAAAATAMDVAYPYERQLRPTVPPAATPIPDLADRNPAMLWLDAELTNLLAAAQHAGDHGWPEHTWHLFATVDLHLRTRGRHREAQTLHEQALHLAQRLGNHEAEMNALSCLGHVHQMQGRYELAVDHYAPALRIAQEIGDSTREMKALFGLGYLHHLRGRYEQALDHYTRASLIAGDIGDHYGVLDSVYYLGYLHWIMGRHEQAYDHFQRALYSAEKTGDRSRELAPLNGLGHVHRVLGRHGQAADCYRQVLDVARELGSGNWQFEALQGMGRLDLATGRSDLALIHHEQALQCAIDLAQTPDQVRAYDGLGHAHYALGRHDQARRHWQQALDMLTAIGTEHTDDIETTAAQIRAHLATV